MAKRAPRFYEFGDFRLDAAERLLYRGGQIVPLSPKAALISGMPIRTLLA